MLNNFIIYTDGASKKSGNKIFGGYGFVVLLNGETIYTDGGVAHDCTNNQMEMQAIISGCNFVKRWNKNEKNEFYTVIVFSDSAYCVNCYNDKWYKKWIENDWRKSGSREKVLNQDLWEQIIPFFEDIRFTFKKVAGHSNDYFNNLADDIAQNNANSLKQKYIKENKNESNSN